MNNLACQAKPAISTCAKSIQILRLWFKPNGFSCHNHHVRLSSFVSVNFLLFLPGLIPNVLEVIEGMLIDDIELPDQRKGELHHGSDVHVLSVMLLKFHTANKL